MENQVIDIDKEEDIEEEKGNEDISISSPFNPNDIKIKTAPHTLGQILDSLEFNEINLNTEFQRLSDLWTNTKKSRFIESLLLKLPVPIFYFAEQDNGVWEIVDGLQRISTLKRFILDKTLKLENLEFLKEYNGKSFEDLPRDLQRRIKTFPITIYIIEKGTPDLVKYNIFSRINQGGLVLEPQEIRHALHQGVASNLIADLVRGEDIKDENGNIIKKATLEGKAFVKGTQGKIKTRRMEDRDFSNRFVAFYLISYKDYEPDLDSFMNKGMAEITKLPNKKIEELKSDFQRAMNTAWDIFGKDAFRKRFQIKDKQKPINKALFEVLSVNFARLSEEKCKLLTEKKEVFKEKLRDLHNNSDGKFLASITQSTAQKDKVEQRFRDIERIIKETLLNVNDKTDFEAETSNQRQPAQNAKGALTEKKPKP